MTGNQIFTTGSAALQDLDPYRFPAARIDDYVLPVPDPADRPSSPVEPTDRRRLDLHAALTTAGIAPLPGDLDAIKALCRLDDPTQAALRRWINHGA
ncbi:hypothetical protein BN159_1269 [Streptomyces davaonensis JCM 4913]|uniref:Uncharacterized protein n=1 Tax=Streptomyces davaonensis (strain DSM 101723 / JCM 4913 / KCC S-0913 / 768) TaxID=1214101 RepID=K4QX72_STRDJ|nr:hypothetical protein [Streptomyces davaonensis]CCK25648.1 hypothetical protein BN159_1269 [Streptomyces davaonensis JCM 4913]